MEHTIFYIIIIAILTVIIGILLKIVHNLKKQLHTLSNDEKSGDFRDIVHLRGYITYLKKRNDELEQALGDIHKLLFVSD